MCNRTEKVWQSTCDKFFIEGNFSPQMLGKPSGLDSWYQLRSRESLSRCSVKIFQQFGKAFSTVWSRVLRYRQLAKSSFSPERIEKNQCRFFLPIPCFCYQDPPSIILSILTRNKWNLHKSLWQKDLLFSLHISHNLSKFCDSIACT
jgi:hypothetical protein